VGPLGRGAVQEAARSLEAILHSVVFPNPRRNQAAPRLMKLATTVSLRLLKYRPLILWFAPHIEPAFDWRKLQTATAV